MTKLTGSTGKYPGFFRDHMDAEGNWVLVRMDGGWLVPDMVLDVLADVTKFHVSEIFKKHMALDAAGGIVPLLNRHNLQVHEPKLTWEQSCALVTAALTRFNPDVGRRAALVMKDPSRVELKPTPDDRAGGYCSPAGWKGLERAKIYYDFDGTINDAVYMAHELGHLIASDIAQEEGYDGSDTWMPKHVAEVPAMLLQMALYDYVINVQEDRSIKNAGRQHFVGEVTRMLYDQQVGYACQGLQMAFSPELYGERMKELLGENWEQYRKAREKLVDMSHLHGHETAAIIALGLYNTANANKPEVFKNLFGRGKDSLMLDVLNSAKITTQAELRELLSQAVTDSGKPLTQLYAENFGSPSACAKHSNTRVNHDLTRRADF